jgi:hypothetical protein
MPATVFCPHGSHEPKTKESIVVVEARQTNDVQRFEIALLPQNFPLGSVESRAAARAMWITSE